MNINTLNTQLTYLEDTKQQIKQVLINKGQNISNMDTFRSYVNIINNLTDTRDGTAVANDIINGKIVYVNENRVVGNMKEIPNDYIVTQLDITNQNINISADNNSGIQYVEIFNVNNMNGYIENGKFSRNIPNPIMANVLNLTSNMIKAGEVIFGVNGKNSVVETNSANATIYDIVSGKTAFVNGNKLVGNIQNFTNVHTSIVYNSSDGDMVVDTQGNGLQVHIYNRYKTGVYLNNTSFQIEQIPDDVVANSINLTANKLFVGYNVLNIDGTATSDANAVASDILDSKTAYVNGQKIVGNIPVYNTMNIVTSNIDTINIQSSNNAVVFGSNTNMIQGYYTNNAGISYSYSNTNLANAFNIVPNIVKKDEVLFGVVGNYEGLMTAEDYATCNALLDEILGVNS